MKIVLLCLNMLIGIGGVFGSFLALSTEARNRMGISTELLKNSPFATFLIPGLFLLIIIGLGNVFTGYANYRNVQSYAFYECLIGIILMSWLIIQCLLLQSVMFLHVLFFLLGIVQVLFACLIIKKDKRPFPLSAKQH